MHKNKYDHNILLNDIQKLDKIQHKHSLVAIQFPDTSAEKKYLVYYDERWDCKLFLNYKTVDRADEESVINKVSADLNVDKSQINCRYISSKVQEKYSESHQENRIYNHRLYEIKIQVFPEDEQKENFVVNGAYGHFPRPSGPRSPARQGHIKRPVLRLAEPSFLRPANQCC